MKAEKALQAHYEVNRVAALLDMSPRWVKQRVKDGELKGRRLGNRIVIEAGSLNDFLDRCDITGKKRESMHAGGTYP